MKKLSAYLRLSLLILIISLFVNIGCKKDKDPGSTGNDIGFMTIDPGQVIKGQTIDMTIRFTVNPGVKFSGTVGELRVIQIDPNGSKTELTTLYDNGELGDYDEIKGDQVYSNKFYYSADKVGDYQFVIATQILDDKGITQDIESTRFKFTVYNELGAVAINEILTTQENAAQEFKKNIDGNSNNVLLAVDKTLSWLKTQPNVLEATKGSTGISITYSPGINAALIVSVETDNGSFTRGGYGMDSFPSRIQKTIPLSLQTRGITKDLIETRGEDIPVDVIGNRKVLFYQPYHSLWKPWDDPANAQVLKFIEEEKCAKYEVVDVHDLDANVEVVSTFTQYGIIIINTHGLGGDMFSTGEWVNPYYDIYIKKYQALLQAKKLYLLKNVLVRKVGDVDIEQEVYGINSSYIRDLNGRFPNSLILNMSCESTKSLNLFNAFASKGAHGYVGFTEPVRGDFAADMIVNVMEAVVKNGKTVGDMTRYGEVSTFGYGMPQVFAKVDLHGYQNLRMPKDLQNASFEAGLKGWTASGDGRYISTLGPLSPTSKDFMAIISTGLGFTTSSGSIFQSFTVPSDAQTLKYDWNLLSEEFLEYIGSTYQDKFEVIIKDNIGNETILFSRTIDQIATEYGATIDLPGTLKDVSPGIKFDIGGVFMTGFVNASFDISSYQGKCITLEFRCSDVGDSGFDTAVLIDNVQIGK